MQKHTTQDPETGAADTAPPRQRRVLLTPQETADRVKCSIYTLRRWRRDPSANPDFPAPIFIGPGRGRGPEGGVTGGQMYRWVESEIDEYVAGLPRYVPPPAAEREAGR